MELKTYQNSVLEKLTCFLTALAKERDERDARLNHDDEYVREEAQRRDFVGKAWEASKGNGLGYFPQQDGQGGHLPDVYLKVPTGGGKTLLACYAIDHIQHQYLGRATGLVLWVVPTKQIYHQTLEKLSDRDHPYRCVLDRASAGYTLIRERNRPLKPADISGRLVVLLLMLPAATRKSKDLLRMFRDSGSYDNFFPDADDYQAHRQWLEQMPHLDKFGGDGMEPAVIKSSLGNVIRLSRPLIIVDEGQKAYSDLARKTLREFNPAFMLELSATPPKDVSIVASVSGRDLHDEEMIKLDIHLQSTATTKWKDTLLKTIDKRTALEKIAEKYRQNSNRYIRPIALIQVERTGGDQRESGFIHAEDAREFLIQQAGILPEHVAIKSSDKDDIEGVDLLSEACMVRYIITKRALQEGWDCAFAYVLAVLTNPSSQSAMTQLVGRILRQPDANRTSETALNESYVFTRHANASALIGTIKKGLEDEGLGDVSGRIICDTGDGGPVEQKISKMRKKYKKFAGRVYLPQFIIVSPKKLRLLDYDADILGNINWDQLTLKPKELQEIKLGEVHADSHVTVGLPGQAANTDYANDTAGLEVDLVFMTRQLLDVVPNAWRGYALSKKILSFFEKRDGKQKTAENFIFIIEQSKRLLAQVRDKLAQEAFDRLIDKKKLQFVLLTGENGYRVPSTFKAYFEKGLVRPDNSALQRSLFEPIEESDFNGLEKDVALYLDEQENLLWWYRNRVSTGYNIQGWMRHKIYPDFIAAKRANGRLDKVAVIETKGMHLQNADTEYKKSVFDLCTQLCENLTIRDLGKCKTDWQKLGLHFSDNTFLFQMVKQDEWKSAINEIFQ